MVHEFIVSQNTYVLNAEAENWQEAVKIGTNILEQKGFIKPTYYEDIVRQHKEIGPYYVIAPGIAMPHSNPEKGVIKTCWSLVTLGTPIDFGSEGNDPIDIILTLASVDTKEHNEQSIVQVVEIFDTPPLVEAIRNAQNVEELVRGFQLYYKVPVE